MSKQLTEKSSVTYIVNDNRRKNQFQKPTADYVQAVGWFDSVWIKPEIQDSAANNEFSAALCNYVFVYGTLREGEDD